MTIVLFFITGFRYGLETDYWRYYRMFNESSHDLFHGSVYDSTEPLFAIFIIVIRSLFHNYNFFLIVVAAIAIFGKCSIFQGYEYCFVALLLYYLRFYTIQDLNGIRQGVGLLFVLFAVDALLKDNVKKFLILTATATLIHSSCFFIIFSLLCKLMKPTYLKISLLLIAAIVFRCVLLYPTLDYGMRFAALASSSNRLLSGSRYLLYTSNMQSLNAFQAVRIILPVYAFMLIIKSDKQKLLFNIYFFGCILNILFFGFDTIAFRLASVYLTVEGILMALCLEGRSLKFQKTNVRALTCFLIAFSFDLYTFIKTMITSETMIPYRTFLFQ